MCQKHAGDPRAFTGDEVRRPMLLTTRHTIATDGWVTNGCDDFNYGAGKRATIDQRTPATNFDC